MENVFYSDSRADDLIAWAGHIEALGDMLGTLAFHADGMGGESFRTSGERLGMIIGDYAKAINATVGEAYGVLQGFFDDGIDSFLGRLKKDKERIEEGFFGDAKVLEVANNNVQAINRFITGELYEITQLSSWFEKTAKLATEQLNKSQQEKAHAATQAA